MPKKRKGSNLQPRRKKNAKKEEQLPSLPAETVLLPVEDVVLVENEERLPDEDFHVDNARRKILQATSDECPTLDAQATRLAIAYQYLNVLGAPPPEQWDGRDGTVSIIVNSLKIHNHYRRRLRVILSQVYHCHCIGTQYTGERNIKGGNLG